MFPQSTLGRARLVLTMHDLDRRQVRDAVFRAIDKVSESLADENALPRSESAVLLGAEADLDSMGFVNFIAAVEEEMTTVIGRPYRIVDRISSVDKDYPEMSTVGEFIDFLCEDPESE